MGSLARTDKAGTRKPAWRVTRSDLFDDGVVVSFLVPGMLYDIQSRSQIRVAEDFRGVE